MACLSRQRPTASADNRRLSGGAPWVDLHRPLSPTGASRWTNDDGFDREDGVVLLASPPSLCAPRSYRLGIAKRERATPRARLGASVAHGRTETSKCLQLQAQVVGCLLSGRTYVTGRSAQSVARPEGADLSTDSAIWRAPVRREGMRAAAPNDAAESWAFEDERPRQVSQLRQGAVSRVIPSLHGRGEHPGSAQPRR